MNLHVAVLFLYFASNVASMDVNLTSTISSEEKPLFNASVEAASLKHALYTNNIETVVDILTHLPQSKRLEIASKFKLYFGKYLTEVLEEHVEDHSLKHLLIALVVPTKDFYANELHNAIIGIGTNEDVIIDIFCTLSTSELLEVSHAYKTKFESQLIDDIKGDTSGDFKEFLIALLHADPNKGYIINEDLAIVDAKDLYKAGVDKLGTDEDVFYEIFSNRSHYHLKVVFKEYEQLAEHDIEHAIKKEFSGYAKQALLTLIAVVRDMQAYFATRLHECVSEKEKHNRVTRVVVTRSEFDMGLIEKRYHALFHTELEADVATHTKDLYQKALHNLIKLYH